MTFFLHNESYELTVFSSPERAFYVTENIKNGEIQGVAVWYKDGVKTMYHAIYIQIYGLASLDKASAIYFSGKSEIVISNVLLLLFPNYNLIDKRSLTFHICNKILPILYHSQNSKFASKISSLCFFHAPISLPGGLFYPSCSQGESET